MIGRLSPLFSWRGAIADSDLPPTTRLVAWALSMHMNERGGSCFPKRATLARETGLNDQTVKVHLRALRDQGWLVAIGGGSGDKPVEYEAQVPMGAQNTPSEQGGSESTPPRGAEDTPRGRHGGRLETEPKNGSVSPEQTVRGVYDHWRERRRKTNRRYETISDNRRKKIQTRLTEFSAEDLKLAIDCVALDPWSERPLHDDLVVIFRNREQVEKFLAFSEPSVVPGKPERAPPRRYGYGVTAHEMFERAKATAAREEGQRNGAEASGRVGGAADRGLPPGGD